MEIRPGLSSDVWAPFEKQRKGAWNGATRFSLKITFLRFRAHQPCQVSLSDRCQRRTAWRSSVSFWKARQHGSKQWPEPAISSASSHVNAMALPSKAWEMSGSPRLSGKKAQTMSASNFLAKNQTKKLENVRNCFFSLLHLAGSGQVGVATVATVATVAGFCSTCV